jgi:hypothetical protein
MQSANTGSATRIQNFAYFASAFISTTLVRHRVLPLARRGPEGGDFEIEPPDLIGQTEQVNFPLFLVCEEPFDCIGHVPGGCDKCFDVPLAVSESHLLHLVELPSESLLGRQLGRGRRRCRRRCGRCRCCADTETDSKHARCLRQ